MKEYLLLWFRISFSFLFGFHLREMLASVHTPSQHGRGGKFTEVITAQQGRAERAHHHHHN
jgi:hypothetical protein